MCDHCDLLQEKCDMTFVNNIVCQHCQGYVKFSKTLNSDVCHIDITDIFDVFCVKTANITNT